MSLLLLSFALVLLSPRTSLDAVPMRVIAEAPGTPRVGVESACGPPTELTDPARSPGTIVCVVSGASGCMCKVELRGLEDRVL